MRASCETHKVSACYLLLYGYCERAAIGSAKHPIASWPEPTPATRASDDPLEARAYCGDPPWAAPAVERAYTTSPLLRTVARRRALARAHMKPDASRFALRMMSLHALKTTSMFLVSVAHVTWWYMSLSF